VYHAEALPDGAFSVSEWTGGITLADRLAADDTMLIDEFLPNAAGLADALATLHSQGHLHGAIDPDAVFHTVAHPARLGAFGRIAVDHTPREDVQSLSAVLEFALTGSEAGGPPPSEIVDGLDPAVDHALRSARIGRLTARQFADLLRAAPSPAGPPVDPPGRSRRFLTLVAALVVAGLLLIGLGRVLSSPGDGPPIFPTSTAATATVAVPTSPPTTIGSVPSGSPTTVPLEDLTVTSVRSVDPFGGGDENDDRLRDLIDGDPATRWRTERYRDPLQLLKPGVGIAFSVAGSPKDILLSGLEPGTAYQIEWAPDTPDPETWDVLVRARAVTGTPRHQLPERLGGTWVIWFTDLPRIGPDDHSTGVSEVRFRG